jgi:hypothetical protein
MTPKALLSGQYIPLGSGEGVPQQSPVNASKEAEERQVAWEKAYAEKLAQEERQKKEAELSGNALLGS